MKRCPTCNQTFYDPNLSFCIEDGTPLLPVDADAAADSGADEATVVRSGSRGDEPESPAPAYQPPGSYVPRGTPPGYNPQQGKSRTWPWLLGLLVLVLVVFGGLGVAAVMLISRSSLGPTIGGGNYNANAPGGSNRNANRGNANPNTNANTNSSDWNANANSNVDDTTPAPTDEAAVLSDLTELEHEWTVANINADKKALNRILADDYVGTLPDGKLQGKAEYLRTATRDDSIQKWDFEDLKVSLRDDRATLTGVLQLEVKDERGQNQSLAFRFTDKFVWRDGRWQATASEVAPVKRIGVAA